MSKRKLRWRDWRLATKLTVLLAILTATPLLIVTLYNGLVARSSLVSATREQNLVRARGTADMLSLRLQDMLADVELLAVSPLSARLLMQPNNLANHAELRVSLTQIDEIRRVDSVSVMDNKGMVLMSSNARLAGRNYVTSPWFRSAVAGRVSVDEPRYDVDDGGVYLYVSAPVRGLSGAILGAAVMRADMKTIDEIAGAQTPATAQGGFGILWDSLGVRLSQTDRPDLRFIPMGPLADDVSNQLVYEGRYGPSTGELLQSAGGAGAGIVQSKLLMYDHQADPFITVDVPGDGAAQCAMAPLSAKRWVYAVCTPEAEILAVPDEQIKRAVLAALIVAALAAVAATFVARGATQSVLLVSRAAGAMAAGDMTRRVGLDQDDEIGRLAQNFDAMAEALQAKEAQLQEYANRLETRVAERTRELQESLNRLSELSASIRQSEEEVRKLNANLEQRVLERTAQLEDVNKEIEAFANSVSHDLRVPLRAVDGYSRILLEEYASALPADAQRQLGAVRESAQRMNRLADDLLAFTHLGRQPIMKYKVNMGELVKQVWRGFTSELDGRQVEFKTGELLNSRADPALLRQVWANLISNALKFTDNSKQTLIEIGSRMDDTDHQVVYYVRDNGVGFDVRFADRLFGVFQHLHDVQDYPGTGVGLAVVQRIVHRHGGRVWAEGEPDIGATFYFTLPQT